MDAAKRVQAAREPISTMSSDRSASFNMENPLRIGPPKDDVSTKIDQSKVKRKEKNGYSEYILVKFVRLVADPGAATMTYRPIPSMTRDPAIMKQSGCSLVKLQ